MTTTNQLAEPGPGHNLSWVRFDDGGKIVIDAPEMRAYLGEEIAKLISRRDELLASVSRVPAEIGDDPTASRVIDLIKMFASCTKNAEADRIARKEPFLEGGRIVDAVFKQITDPLAKGKTDVERRLTLYQRAQAEAERRRREAVAQAEREEADRKRREAEAAAEAMQSEDDLAAATTAEEEARMREADAIAAARAADAKPAEMSRQRSDMGGVASLHRFWDMTDLDRERLDLEALRAHLPLDALEKAVRSFVRAGGRELRGVRIFENTETRVR